MSQAIISTTAVQIGVVMKEAINPGDECEPE
jgi:hypothetical protein